MFYEEVKKMQRKTGQYQQQKDKTGYDILGIPAPKEQKATLLDRLQKEVKDFKEVMADFSPDCGVKYGPETIQQLFKEIRQYSDPSEGYGKKWMKKDYEGAIKDLRYAIACLNFIGEIASVETIQFLIPQFKSEEGCEYEDQNKLHEFIDTQVKDLESTINQIHLDWDSTNSH